MAPSRQAKTVPPLGRTVNPDQIWPSDTTNTLQGAVELRDPAIKHLLLGHDGKTILQVQKCPTSTQPRKGEILPSSFVLINSSMKVPHDNSGLMSVEDNWEMVPSALQFKI